jgi:hypothetical protein
LTLAVGVIVLIFDTFKFLTIRIVVKCHAKSTNA